MSMRERSYPGNPSQGQGLEWRWGRAKDAMVFNAGRWPSWREIESSMAKLCLMELASCLSQLQLYMRAIRGRNSRAAV